MAEPKRPSEIRLQDPLSAVTRAERKTLLGVSTLGIVIARSGLVPSRISALGIEFDRADQSAILQLLAAVVAYFVIAFLVYGVSDLVAWRIAFRESVIASKKEYERLTEAEHSTEERLRASLPPSGQWLIVASRPVSAVRAGLEFGVPLVVGLVAMYLLVSTPPPRAGTPTPTLNAPNSSIGAPPTQPKNGLQPPAVR